jgi:hypothetical protein
MILDTTTRSLEILLGAAVAANQLKVTSDWIDITTTTSTAGTTPATTNSTTPVTIVAAPAASTQRKVYAVNILNLDTASVTVTVQLNDNATIYKKITATIPPNATLQYTDTDGWSVIGGYASASLVGVNAQTGTTYTLALADAGQLVTLSNASGITLTVPANGTVAFPIGTIVMLAQIGAGQVTVAAAGGVTINKAASLTARVQYSALWLTKYLSDTWLLTGDAT